VSLKKLAGKKEKVRHPLRSESTNAFQKDWTRLERSGRYDTVRLKAVMMDLIGDHGPLDASRLDHALKGSWADYRECHIGGDFS
jgi:mRNA interferase YafQ